MSDETLEKLKSIGKGAVIAGLGAVAAYVAQASANADFGMWTPIFTAVAAVAVNALRKFTTTA